MFVFGLVVGLVIGSVIAVFVYHNNQVKFNEYIDIADATFDEAKEKIEELEAKIEDLLAPKAQPEQK